MLRLLRFERESKLLEELDGTAPCLRVQRILDVAPYGWIAVLLRIRYRTLAVILNLPGNAVMAEAGGIGAIAEMSRLF
jgi:hypothetical protein